MNDGRQLDVLCNTYFIFSLPCIRRRSKRVDIARVVALLMGTVQYYVVLFFYNSIVVNCHREGMTVLDSFNVMHLQEKKIVSTANVR